MQNIRRACCLATNLRNYSIIRNKAFEFKGSSHGNGFCMCGFCTFGKIPPTNDNTILKHDEEIIHSKILKEDPDIAVLLEQNKNWVSTQEKQDENFFKRIGGPQKPKYL